MTKTPKEKGRIVKWIASNPWVSIASLVFGALGFGLAIYSTFVNIEKPELSYHVHPVKTAVVNKNATSRISVFYDGKAINSNVSIAQIEIWNGGRKPIRNEDILSQPMVCIEDSTSILEARILKTSRSEAGIVLDTLAIDKGIVNIDWVILEKGDGAILQLIYKGGIEKKIVASATIVKQKSIIKIKTILDRAGHNYALVKILLMILLAIFICLLYVTIQILIEDKPKGWNLVSWILLVLFSAIITSFLALVLYALFTAIHLPIGF
ncbi:MAG: hypothetical protein PHY48_15680 [Candidatus Cloacimonetes bacterium]|jgi:hypothetical protein|nr:hypothetical protein [Candidatus Cloacimonadota bacterium]